MTIETKLKDVLILNQMVEKTSDESEINYSKYNPFVWSNNHKKCKRFKKITFILAILVAVFAAISGLISLWFATKWGKNTLIGLGIDLTKYENLIIKPDPPKSTTLLAAVNSVTILQSNFNKLNESALYQWSSTKWMSGDLLSTLVGFSFTALFLILPLLSFKRGTLIWTITIFAMVILSIAVISILILGLIDQSEVVSIFKNSDKKNLDDLLKIIKLVDANIEIETTY